MLRADYITGGSITWKNFMAEHATTASSWQPAPEDMATQSQITQLAGDIDLRVGKNDIISQINLSTEGVLIAGEKVHITGQTIIDDAVITTANIKDAAITSAKITSIEADKISAGTITGAVTATNFTLKGGKILIDTSDKYYDMVRLNCNNYHHLFTPYEDMLWDDNAGDKTTLTSGCLMMLDNAGTIVRASYGLDSVSFNDANGTTLSSFSRDQLYFINESAESAIRLSYYDKDELCFNNSNGVNRATLSRFGLSFYDDSGTTKGFWSSTTGEIQAEAANSYRLINGNYGAFWRNDGNGLFLLLTNAGDQYGSFNSFRPLSVNFSTGVCTVNGCLPLTGGTLTGDFTMTLGKTIFWSSGARITTSANQQLYFGASSENDYQVFLGVRDSMWGFGPRVSGNVTLGSPNYRWGTVYSNTGTINTSDRNEKNTIKALDTDLWSNFINSLEPVTYRLNEGESGRKHAGLIAQDVEVLMESMGIDSKDFAGFIKFAKCDEDGNEVLDEKGNTVYGYGLRYEEFISPIITTVQKLHKETEILRSVENFLKSQNIDPNDFMEFVVSKFNKYKK